MSGPIVGMPELLKKLDALGKVGKGRVMIMAVIAGAMEIVNEAKILVHKITGTCMRSIHIGGHSAESSPGFTPKDEAGEYSDLGGEIIGDNEASVLIGTNLDYAAPLEFGSADGSQPANPFLRPAIDTKTKRAFEVIAVALKRLIEAAVK